MPIVHLGNSAAHEWGRPIPGNQVTTVVVPDSDDLATALRTITHEDGLWPRSSFHPAAWVECDADPVLEGALAEYFNCPIGRPADWSN
jgi:hypothetical protein